MGRAGMQISPLVRGDNYCVADSFRVESFNFSMNAVTSPPFEMPLMTAEPQIIPAAPASIALLTCCDSEIPKPKTEASRGAWLTSHERQWHGPAPRAGVAQW